MTEIAPLTVDLGISLAAYEAAGLPDAFVDAGCLVLLGAPPIGPIPDRILVHVRVNRSDPSAGYVYVAFLEGTAFDERTQQLRYEHVCELEPVRVGATGDDSPYDPSQFLGENHGRVSPTAFERILREGRRRTLRLSEDVLTMLDTFSAQTGESVDRVIDTAVRSYIDGLAKDADDPEGTSDRDPSDDDPRFLVN